MTVVLTKTGKFTTFDHPNAVAKGETAGKDTSKETELVIPCVSNTKPAENNVGGQVTDLEHLILQRLAETEVIEDTWEYSNFLNVDHQQLVGVIKSLLVDQYVVDEPLSSTYWALTDEGKDVVMNGSPEIQVLNCIPPEGISIANLNAKLGETAKIGMGVCMKNKWIQKKGDIVIIANSLVSDETANILKQIDDNKVLLSEEEYKNLKKRKLVQQVTRKSYRISKGHEFRIQRVKKVADLHKSMLGTKEEVIFLIVFLSFSFLFINFLP